MAEPIDLILAIDALTPPLTGIGRYTFELVQGLQQHAQMGRLRCFSMSRWVASPVAAGSAAETSVAAIAAANRLGELRRLLAANRTAVRAYQLLVPQLARWQLRHERAALFHSPNYALPPFPGKAVATVHDLSHALYPQFHPAARVDYMRRAFPHMLARATHLITDAESVRAELIERHGWPAERVSAVPLGVDPSFQPRSNAVTEPLLRRHGLRHRGYSLFVGTIEPRKNIDRLLDAYAELPATLRRDFPLVIAGARGWQSAATHARMAQAQGAGWLHYLSYLPQAELPLLYAGARLFVYPSLYEGFGLPVLEAMASGVPVITSNVASMPEVAGDTGRLIDPESVDELTAALLQLLPDDGWLQRAGAAGASRARAFTWQRCVAQTVQVYQQVLQQEPH